MPQPLEQLRAHLADLNADRAEITAISDPIIIDREAYRADKYDEIAALNNEIRGAENGLPAIDVERHGLSAQTNPSPQAVARLAQLDQDRLPFVEAAEASRAAKTALKADIADVVADFAQLLAPHLAQLAAIDNQRRQTDADIIAQTGEPSSLD